ncbi:TerC family protein [Planctopirus hydrillae]|uniref:Integral membrane protein TerC n=1 Tax=Planctopirus hydrillae TaxID=1841610 RepID=A0A1C3EUB8_9PLAN|nr:TerC family protein [Planctopirus hydrillae]ODA36839.1 hypothetical protein A6X21_01850 [Planctopirus hydrillae]
MFSTELIIAFFTLTLLEIVLGIDNIIFIAILAGKLPKEQQNFARQLGISLAVVSRIGLLFSLSWVLKLKEPLFTILETSISGKDLVLIAGGLFLIGKATYEIHHKVTVVHEAHKEGKAPASLFWMLAQVIAIDVVFSLDSVITAVGITDNIPVIVAAVIVSVIVMLIFSGAIVRFVDDHPAIKLLALSFLLLIGVLLVGEGFHHKIPKGYVYFAMAFSLGIELLQMWQESNVRKAQIANQPASDASTTGH